MSRIVATGSYLPEKILTNKELIKRTGIDSNDEWITQRTGIHQRHFAFENETVSDLAIQSAKNLLKQLDAEIVQEIQLILVATMSSCLPTPSVASQVQRGLGIKQALAFDISGACSGFIMALEVAEKISRSQSSGYTLVIGAEKMSNILNFEDRSTSILFGDGAGAVLIKHNGEGLENYQSELISLPDPKNSIYVPAEKKQNGQMTMDGREVFNFVLRQVIPSLSNFIQDYAKDFDYLIGHQANYRFIEILAKKLRVSLSKIPANIDKVANTSAGSIPILLDQLVKEGTIHLNSTQKVVLVGYGAGLAWGQISLTI